MAVETILHLDTTTNRLHLGLSQAGQTLSQVNQPCESHRYHSAVIVPAIQEMLRQNGMQAKHLTALAVNLGPGSFTGIRTGIITARTMGQFLNIPVYGFNAFELLATQFDTPVAIYLDALRNRTYQATLSFGSETAIYQQEPNLKLLNPEQPPSHTEAVLVSPTLATLFKEPATQLIPEDYSPIQPMLDLIRRYGSTYQRDWDSIKPLYLQDPSITLKKKPLPKTASCKKMGFQFL
jgi:tRNA threonylcarbamoyl adenosine modification protein YeaZ